MKETPLRRMLQEKPEEVLKASVNGMLPKSKLRAPMMKRLKVFVGPQHSHAAQKLETLEV